MRKCHGRQSLHRAAGHAAKRSLAPCKTRIRQAVAAGGTGKYAPLGACLLLHNAEAFTCPRPGMDAVESRACLVDQAGTALPCTEAVQQ